MTPRTRRIAVLAGFLATATALASCGSDSGNNRPGAAEPATAAAPAVAPAGVVRPLANTPEGIVYDPRTSLLAVAVRKPDRLLLLDPSTFAIRRMVPLPGDVRHLQLGGPGGPVLVPVESANQIVQVVLPSGVTSVNDVRKQPHDAAEAGNGDVVVGDEFGKSISIVRRGKVIKTIADLQQPGGVVATEGATVAVVDVGAFTLSTYDLRTLKRTGRIAAGKGPTHGEALTGNRVLVADTRGNRMLVFSASPLKQIGSMSLPGTPYGMAVDRTTDTVWVTLTAKNQVVGLNVSGNTPKVIARYPTVRQPNTVAVAPGSKQIWVTGTTEGELQLITR